jgi:hypothetical protein
LESVEDLRRRHTDLPLSVKRQKRDVDMDDAFDIEKEKEKERALSFLM